MPTDDDSPTRPRTPSAIMRALHFEAAALKLRVEHERRLAALQGDKTMIPAEYVDALVRDIEALPALTYDFREMLRDLLVLVEPKCALCGSPATRSVGSGHHRCDKHGQGGDDLAHAGLIRRADAASRDIVVK
jgi:hypothetical protein